jgi:hypothetical protein
VLREKIDSKASYACFSDAEKSAIGGWGGRPWGNESKFEAGTPTAVYHMVFNFRTGKSIYFRLKFAVRLNDHDGRAFDSP